MPEHEDNGLRLIDTSEALTLDELKELKKLASLSKATRVFLGILFAIVGLIGVPALLDWFAKGHIQ